MALTSSPLIIGTVIWQVDYAMSFARMREKLDEFLKQSKLWDGKVGVLQVIDTTERTVTIRALMSAHNSPTAWDLRCEIREKMLVWMQEDCPEGLPRLRNDVTAALHAPDRAATGSDGQEPLTPEALDRMGVRQ